MGARPTSARGRRCLAAASAFAEAGHDGEVLYPVPAGGQPGFPRYACFHKYFFRLEKGIGAGEHDRSLAKLWIVNGFLGVGLAALERLPIKLHRGAHPLPNPPPSRGRA